MTRPLTADEAAELIRSNPNEYSTPERLRALAAQVDADSPGQLTVLYSGQAAKGISSTDVINSMVAAGEDVRVINRSQAAKLLESEDFKYAVGKSFGLPDPNVLSAGSYRGPATDWLYHPTEGPWADASARFADKTVGEVRAIVSDAQPNRTFGAIEVPHILANHNVTTVESIPRDVLVVRQSTHGTQAAFEMIVARARDNVGTLQVPVNYAGMPLRGDDGVIPMDSRAYLVGTQIEGKTPSFTTVTRLLADSMNPPTEYALAGQRHLDDLQAQLAQSERAMEAARGAPIRRMGAAVGLGVAASAYDAIQTGSHVSNQLAQDNPLAAQSALTHYAARGTGGWVGGATAGALVTATATGPGVVGFIVIGGAAAAGVHIGKHVAEVLDSHKVFKQTDRQGVHWESNGRQWVRQEQGDLNDDGINAPAKQSFSALPEKARELNYLASNVATELALGKVEQPRDPYNLPANDKDSKSLGDANWKLNAQTGDWQRETVIARTDRGHPLTRTDTASPERAAELSREAEQVIKANIAAGPAPVAARYELAHKAYGWQSFGEVPSAVTAALANGDRLIASDNQAYQRGADGQWRTESGELAQANIPRELDGMREQLRPALAQHAEQLAAAPEWRKPTREELDRINLGAMYESIGVMPNPNRFDAALEAVQRTRDAQGIDANITSLYLERNAKGGYDANSPIVHLGRDSQGVHVVAETSLQEIELALVDLRGLNSPAPDMPELRVVTLSPPQRDAQEQTAHEADRPGLSNEQVHQDVQQSAFAPAASAIPVDAQPIRDQEPIRVVVEPEPAPTPTPTPTPIDPASAAPPPTTADANVVEPKETELEAEPPAAVPVTEPEKPDVVATKPPVADTHAAQPVSTQDSSTKTPNQPAPQVSPPVAANAAPAPDDGILRRGDRGSDVEFLQFRLQRAGYRGPDEMPAPEKGHFDAATEHAVCQLQRDHGLPDTGCVDPDTVHALAVAQQAKVESKKAVTEPVVVTHDRMVVDSATPGAPLAHYERLLDQTASDERAHSSIASRHEQSRPQDSSLGHGTIAENVAPDHAQTTRDVARLSPADQLMFAKIRGQVTPDVPDEVVAKAMLEAKRNGIPDVERIGQVGLADGKLWVGGTTPGFHAVVSTNGPVPSMQDTLKETQAVNQHLAQEAAQRGPDDPSRGPKV